MKFNRLIPKLCVSSLKTASGFTWKCKLIEGHRKLLDAIGRI